MSAAPDAGPAAAARYVFGLVSLSVPANSFAFEIQPRITRITRMGIKPKMLGDGIEPRIARISQIGLKLRILPQVILHPCHPRNPRLNFSFKKKLDTFLRDG